MKNQIKVYYTDLANNYDDDRFNNTYGRFINSQEKKILNKILKINNKNNVLDIGCGTGRFLDFANFGVDINEAMVKIARQKYPNKNILVKDASDTGFENATFNIVISFHLLMHLDVEKTKKIIDEAHRVLQNGGRLIFDIPSKKRRKLVNYTAQNWHAANSFSKKDITKLLGDKWKLNNYYGILFFPIHRFPKKIRKLFIGLDNLFCQSFLKEYSSYLLFDIEKTGC